MLRQVLLSLALLTLGGLIVHSLAILRKDTGDHNQPGSLPWQLRLKAAWCLLKSRNFFLVTDQITAASANREIMLRTRQAVNDALGELNEEIEEARRAESQWDITKKVGK